MAWWEVILIALSLGADAFAVALGIGTSQGTPRRAFRLSFHFGLFQFVMPIAGSFAGRELAQVIRAYDHWVAFGLLGAIGGKMLWDSLRGGERAARGDRSRGWSLVVLSWATSMDAFGVGLGLGVLRHSVFWPAVVVGATAAAMTLAGLGLGQAVSRKFGRITEAFGGVILLAIGVRLLSV